MTWNNEKFINSFISGTLGNKRQYGSLHTIRGVGANLLVWKEKPILVKFDGAPFIIENRNVNNIISKLYAVIQKGPNIVYSYPFNEIESIQDSFSIDHLTGASFTVQLGSKRLLFDFIGESNYVKVSAKEFIERKQLNIKGNSVNFDFTNTGRLLTVKEAREELLSSLFEKYNIPYNGAQEFILKDYTLFLKLPKSWKCPQFDETLSKENNDFLFSPLVLATKTNSINEIKRNIGNAAGKLQILLKILQAYQGSDVFIENKKYLFDDVVSENGNLYVKAYTSMTPLNIPNVFEDQCWYASCKPYRP